MRKLLQSAKEVAKNELLINVIATITSTAAAATTGFYCFKSVIESKAYQVCKINYKLI